MKIRYKITVYFALLVSAILLLLSFFVYYFTALERKEVFNKRLKSRANNDAQIFSLFGDSSVTVLNRIDASFSDLLPEKSVQIYNYLNEPVYNFRSDSAAYLQMSPDILEEARVKGEVFFTNGRREAIAYHYTDSANRVVIVVGAFDEDGWDRLGQLQEILLISLLIGIAVTLAIGYLFSSQLLKPITQIIHEVNDISSINLSHRIKAGSSQDELNQLANTFNDLLNRLGESFNIQRRFISNASHELSTPLTSISSQLEVTLQKDRTVEEYQHVMQSVLEDVWQMRQLTKSLLEIAKAGSEGSIELVELRIDEVLFRVTADVQRINHQYQVQLHFGDFPEDERNFMVFGSIELLYSALKNIVENGCKYSPNHTSFVKLSLGNHEVIIEVRNEGDVIAEEEIEQIFQPFYRSAAASETRGFGLGLALAKRIIGMHKGQIQVASDIRTGTLFTIRLPSM